MSDGGRLYLILVCIVFLSFVAILMWGMLSTSHLEDDDRPTIPPEGRGH